MSARSRVLTRVFAVILTAVLLLAAGCEPPQMEPVDPSPTIPTLAKSFEQPTKPVVGRNDFSLDWRIWVLNVYTGKIWYAGQGMMPLWSPDEKYLAIEVDRPSGGWGIKLVGEKAPSCNVRVGHSPFAYAWGADGQSIIYDSEDPRASERPHTLYRIAPGADAESTPIPDSNILHDGWWGYGIWTGRPVKRLAWGRRGQSYNNSAHGRYNVLDIRRDGTVLLCSGRNVVVKPSNSGKLLKLCELPGEYDHQSVAVSPDLSRLAYSVPLKWGQIKKLHIRNLATGQDRDCGDGQYPRWSPDSLWVACSRPHHYGPGGDIPALYLMDRNGEHRRTIGPGQSNSPGFMDWSSDGESLAYSVPPTYSIRRR